MERTKLKEMLEKHLFSPVKIRKGGHDSDARD